MTSDTKNHYSWDPLIVAKLATAPYSTMAQDGSQDVQIAALLNAETVAGPRADVPVASVTGYLALQGALYSLKVFAGAALNQTQPHDNALIAANELLTVISDLRVFQTSDPAIHDALKVFLDALVANGNLTQPQEDAMLKMAETTIPWWRIIGMETALNEHDLARARAGGL
jgi:hypothetical protein